jgi:hypothetical protein
MDSPDPFSPETLRLDAMFVEGVPVKKYISTIPVKKPNRQDFIRVRDGEGWSLNPVAVLDLKEDREVYLVRPHLVEVLANEVWPAALYLGITRLGTVFIWPVRIAAGDRGRSNWHLSAMDAAEAAKKMWIRVTANLSAGAYEYHAAMITLPEPEWPTLTFSEILRIAFRDRIIDSEDHPVVRRLRGQC